MCDYTRVCAIDVGYRNFAYCVVDNLNWKTPVHIGNIDLWSDEPNRRRQPTKEDCVEITVKWIAANKAMLKDCDVIILENQLRTSFIIMNAVIHALCFSKTKVIHPMTVASFWKLPKTRIKKKPAGVAVAQANGVVFGKKHYKLDDLADAWLMAVHALVLRKAISAKELVFLEF